MDDSIWARVDSSWPKSGPLRWAALYFSFVSVAGGLLWGALSFISPTEPDFASTAHIPRLHFGRGTPDFYVQAFDAYALRIVAAHFGVLALVGGAIGLLNVGARNLPGAE